MRISSWFSEPPHQLGHRSIAQRFAIPHSFPPDLSFPEVLIRVFAALARILLGSTLFALWGVASARAWSAIPSHFWRIPAVLTFALLFLIALTALMLAVSALVKSASQKLH
jgi:hypothetical protein